MNKALGSALLKLHLLVDSSRIQNKKFSSVFNSFRVVVLSCVTTTEKWRRKGREKEGKEGGGGEELIQVGNYSLECVCKSKVTHN